MCCLVKFCVPKHPTSFEDTWESFGHGLSSERTSADVDLSMLSKHGNITPLKLSGSIWWDQNSGVTPVLSSEAWKFSRSRSIIPSSGLGSGLELEL